MELKTADGGGLLEDLLLLVLSLTIKNEQLVATIELDLVGETA